MKKRKNRLWELISRRKIRQQLYIIYILAVCIPIAIIGSFLMGNTARLLTDYHQDLLVADSMRVRTILFEITAQIYNISEEIAFEDTLQEILSLEEKHAAGGAAYSYATMDNYISSHAEIEDVTIYTDNAKSSPSSVSSIFSATILGTIPA